MNTQEMLSKHPQPTSMDVAAVTHAVDAAFECSQVCTSCADACLAEDMVAELRYCIRTNLDCADICNTTARVLSRQTEPDMGLLRAQLGACVQACKACGDECEKHASMHEHCAVCAASCRQCEEACNALLQQLG
jgi:hypothetical protein